MLAYSSSVVPFLKSQPHLNLSPTLLISRAGNPSRSRISDPLTMLPVLPPEILQEIVDAYSQLDDSDSADSSGARLRSPSMLALLSTSRQLRLCVTRHIFHDIHICCGEVDEPTDKLRQLIMPDSAADLPLGSIAPNIKALYIHIAKDFSDNSPCNDSADKLFYGSLLDSIRDQSPLRTLFLGGFITNNLACPWDGLLTDFQRTVTSLLRLLSLKSFEIYRIGGMDGEILRGTTIQKLSVASSLEFRLFNNPVVNIPAIQNHDIVSLRIHYAGVPAMLSLPNLQHLSASYLPPQCLDALWRIITSWRNLTRLEIDDSYLGHTIQSYAIPESINITLLPRLEIFTYRHTHPHPGPPESTVLPQVTFFRVKDSVCAALKHVDIQVFFAMPARTREELMSRVAADPSWDTLDHVLTSPCFPSFAKFKLTLEQTLVVRFNPQQTDRATRSNDIVAVRALCLEVESILRPSFSRLIKNASVTLELDCPVFPFVSH